MNGCVSFTVTFVNLLAENKDFRLVFQRLTLCRGSLVVDITDDSLVEGTESFVISGDATAPASFVSGNDSVTVNILDNDGKCGQLYAHASRFILLHDQFTQRIRKQMCLTSLCIFPHTCSNSGSISAEHKYC